MGQKVHPFGFRLGVIQDWSSRWYAGKKDYVELLHKDLEIRRYVKQRLDKSLSDGRAEIAKIDIERAGRKVKIILHAGRPAWSSGRAASAWTSCARSSRCSPGRTSCWTCAR
jgi:small subunit ribosomal protein S3